MSGAAGSASRFTKVDFEVVNAVNSEEALRFTAGLNPALVVIHSELDGSSPMELYTRLAGTGLELPPFLILSEFDTTPDDQPTGGEFHFLDPEGLDPARFLYQVRLLLLAREIGGEVGEDLDTLFGDLTRIAFGDLLLVLERDRITGHLRLNVGPGAGIWLSDGKVIQAYWGNLKARKAFNRIAGLHQGAFVLDLVAASVEPAIDVELGVLVSDAIEERLQLEDLFGRLPSLKARVGIQMGHDFFAIDFSPLEREVLTQIQEARNFGDLINRVTMTDLETVMAIERLSTEGVLEIKEPTNRIHLVTDSTCDLLPSFARSRMVHVVPLSVVFGKTVYKDGVDLLPDEFYQMLKGADIFPSTSPPGKGEFLEVYRRLVATGDVVSIHISSKQSKTAEHAAGAAVDGANEFAQLRLEADGVGVPEVRIIDSKSNSVGLGMLVVFASRMIDRGLGIEEIVSRIEDIRERLQFVFLVDTLEFLRKGGRIGQAKALIGTLLGIKPILGQIDGEVVPVDKVRGGRRAQPKLMEILRRKGRCQPTGLRRHRARRGAQVGRAAQGSAHRYLRRRRDARGRDRTRRRRPRRTRYRRLHRFPTHRRGTRAAGRRGTSPATPRLWRWWRPCLRFRPRRPTLQPRRLSARPEPLAKTRWSTSASQAPRIVSGSSVPSNRTTVPMLTFEVSALPGSRIRTSRSSRWSFAALADWSSWRSRSMWYSKFSRRSPSAAAALIPLRVLGISTSRSCLSSASRESTACWVATRITAFGFILAGPVGLVGGLLDELDALWFDTRKTGYALAESLCLALIGALEQKFDRHLAAVQ